MNAIVSFFKLVRIQNLIIIALTQYTVRWCLIYPILKSRDFELQLSELQFFLLSLSVVLIAAAGYAINDYFDVRIDKVNKPQRVVIDHGVKRRVAMGSHTVMNLIAIGIALYVAVIIGIWKLAFVHFIVAAGLWFYSTTFKRQFLLGNLVIAIFTAIIPFVIGIYELAPCYKVYADLNPEPNFNRIWQHLLALSFFAFMSTLIREIIKDMEDVDGDKEFGCQTLPIVLGKTVAKSVVVILVLIMMASLVSLQIVQWRMEDLYSFYYFTIALQLPFVVLLYKVVKAQTQEQFRMASHITKFVMLMGISYLFLFAHLLLKYLDAIQ